MLTTTHVKITPAIVVSIGIIQFLMIVQSSIHFICIICFPKMPSRQRHSFTQLNFINVMSHSTLFILSVVNSKEFCIEFSPRFNKTELIDRLLLLLISKSNKNLELLFFFIIIIECHGHGKYKSYHKGSEKKYQFLNKKKWRKNNNQI